MAKNKMADLNDHLFAALEGLSDTENPMDLERARAIATVAQTIINGAKVQVDAARTFKRQTPGEFFGMPEDRQIAAAPLAARKPSLDDESRELPESTTRLTRQMEAERNGRVAM